MQVDVMFIDGCPFWQQAVEKLYTAWEVEGRELHIHLVKVRTIIEAQLLRFRGSPSFAIDGQDLWPERSRAVHTGCRNYQTPEGYENTPTVEMLRQKLNMYTELMEKRK